MADPAPPARASGSSASASAGAADGRGSPPGEAARSAASSRASTTESLAHDDDDAPSSAAGPPHPLAFENLSIAAGGASSASAAPDHAAIRRLMRQGAWRAIADMVQELKRQRAAFQARAADERLVYAAYHVLALVKLRKFAAAQAELAASLGDDLDAPQLRFENQHAAGSRSGSMVPFGLRLLHAQLPHQVGQTAVTVDRLYNLLAHCNARIDFLLASAERLGASSGGDCDGAKPPAAQSGSPAGDSHGKAAAAEEQQQETDSPVAAKAEDVGSNFVASGDDSFGEFVYSDGESEGNVVYATLIRRWRRRQEVVLSALLGHHLEQKEFLTCLSWLEDLVRKRPRDVVVLSKYGYVRLQLGDLYGARHTFAAIESICEQQGRSSRALAALVSRNRGLLFFSLKQYPKALKDFNAALEIDAGDVVSANNKALCLMYSRDLIGATEALETVLQASPITALNETVVLNLCSMYELASMNSVESKKALSSWILRIAPDDFDLTCTRL